MARTRIIPPGTMLGLWFRRHLCLDPVPSLKHKSDSSIWSKAISTVEQNLNRWILTKWNHLPSLDIAVWYYKIPHYSRLTQKSPETMLFWWCKQNLYLDPGPEHKQKLESSCWSKAISTGCETLAKRRLKFSLGIAPACKQKSDPSYWSKMNPYGGWCLRFILYHIKGGNNTLATTLDQWCRWAIYLSSAPARKHKLGCPIRVRRFLTREKPFPGKVWQMKHLVELGYRAWELKITY